MYSHAIAAHAVLVPLVLAALAAVVAVALGRDSGRTGRLGDPLDVELVRRWNAHRP